MRREIPKHKQDEGSLDTGGKDIKSVIGGQSSSMAAHAHPPYSHVVKNDTLYIKEATALGRNMLWFYYMRLKNKLPQNIARQNYFVLVTAAGQHELYGYDTANAKLMELSQSDEEKGLANTDVKNSLKQDKTTTGKVTDFEKAVKNAKSDDEVKAEIEYTSDRLWDEFSRRITENALNTNKQHLEGNLYWARVWMRGILIRSLPNHLRTYLPQYLHMLQQYSRGMDSSQIELPKDRKIKRILIAGFDPFQSRRVSKKPFNNSAQIALHFDSNTISANGKQAYIEAVIFPVKYVDFDNQMVEKFFAPYLDKVDAIVTFSQGHDKVIDIERFYANARGGWPGNNNKSSKLAPVSKAQQFYETNLPVDQLITKQELKDPKQYVYFDQSFVAKKRNGRVVGRAWPFDAMQKKYRRKSKDRRHNKNEYSGRSPLATKKRKKWKAVEGSGSDFFSNELPYRVAHLIHSKGKQNALTYGHVHVPALASETRKTINSVDVLLKRLLGTLK